MNRIPAIGPVLARVLALAFAALLPACAPIGAAPVATAPATQRAPVTILVSIDGFRADYLDRGITPHLSALADGGTSAAMRPSFPSKTFPNHWTLVTGKVPDHHGIVGNRMEDPRRPGQMFSMASKDPFWWNEAKPIWTTAEEQGVRTATMFWPGSEVELDDTRPGDWWPFNQSVSNDRRLAAVLDWMRRPAETRPRFVSLYFDTVDSAGHRYGPAPSPELNAAIAEVDARIGDLVDGLAAMGQPADIVVVSDHGMAATGPDRVFDLDTVLAPDLYHLVVAGNYAGIEPLADNKAQVEAAFLAPHDHMQCWKRQNIPARLNYGSNPRVPPIICLPETGWLAISGSAGTAVHAGGGHGYDNASPEMAAIFIANGPDIAKAGRLATFDNVDVYPFLSRLLDIRPEPSDGTIEPLLPALR